MRFAITGIDPRFPLLRELLLADGHVPAGDAAAADVVIPPPWDPRARYARSESFLAENALLTARGAAALTEKELSLAGKRVLILGYGRVGSLCAEEFRDRGAAVTAAARRRESRTWAKIRGFDAAELAPGMELEGFDVIVNTVPAPVLTLAELRRTGEDALLLELASAPGGIDAAAARELGRRYLSAPGLPGKYAPARAAEILRDAVYETMAEPLPRLGVALTGSHCSFDKALAALEGLERDYELVPILSERAASTDTAFGPAADFRARLETLCGGRRAADSVVLAEPFGTRQALDALLVAPCTGNTLGKLANGVTDTAVTMACKAHLRNGRPLVLAISTNDGLSGSAENIGRLLQRKNVYFVPFRQDAPFAKPFSLQADWDRIRETVEAAREGRQLQPVLR